MSISNDSVYESYLDQNSKPVSNLELTTLNILRRHHPNHHITITKPSRCDLLGFAAAGHATSTPTDHPFDHFTRIYTAPPTRLDPTATGTLTDETSFALYTYTWTTHTFLLYSLTYQDRYMRPVKLLYILHPSTPTARTNPTTDALLLASGKWTRELHEEIYVFDNAEWKKDREMWRSVSTSSWDDVILDSAIKSSLINDVDTFFDPATRQLYNEMNVPWKRGVILHGEPGNGKTVSIKALIKTLGEKRGVPALYVKSLDACAGPKWAIQAIFERARKMAPCLVVFEDLESMVTPKTRSYFLNEMDGVMQNEGILMVGSTNYLGRLDPAVAKRPSRFDRKYHFRMPDVEGSEKKEGKDGVKEKVKKVKTLPEVEIPESIRDNLLVHIIKKQTTVLLAEMDDADEEPQVSNASCGSGNGDSMAAQIYRMQVEAAADASV